MYAEEDLIMRSEKKPYVRGLITEDFVKKLLQPHEESLQQGIQQGERLALQDVLQDLLAAEGVAADLAPKIAEADSSQLRAWTKSLIGGASPRQLFAEG